MTLRCPLPAVALLLVAALPAPARAGETTTVGLRIRDSRTGVALLTVTK